MADKFHEMTDKKLAEMEQRLSAIYSRAEKEIGVKWKNYLEESGKEIEALQKAYDKAKADGMPELVKKTGYELGRAKREQTVLNKYFKDLTAQTAEEISHVNETALAYINDQLPTVYTMNYNALSQTVNGIGGYSFTLTNANTVKYLAEADRNLLPYKKIDGRKDVRWNVQKINAEVLQGILQGDSMDDIARRFSNVMKMDEVSAIRNARTTVTSAECKGRQDSYERARDDGIDIKKQWMSTLDMRTRHSHALLDGKTVEIDEPFEAVLDDGTPTKIMYPADPNAVPEMVYNCRCTTIADVGQEKAKSRMARDDNSNSVLVENMSYEEWYKWKTGKPFVVEKKKVTIEMDKDGAMRNVPKTAKAEKYSQSIKHANPNYAKDWKYEENCANCVVANELRIRGYDVTALPYNSKTKISYFWDSMRRGNGSWTDSFSGLKVDAISASRKDKCRQAVVDKMLEYGDGARAVVFVQWDGRKIGHYFSAINDKGEIKFIDAQNSTEDASDYFDRIRPSKTRLFRVDDKNIAEFAREVVDWNGK